MTSPESRRVQAQERMDRPRRSPLYIGIVKGYGESTVSLQNRQAEAIDTLLNRDASGQGKVVLFVDNPIRDKQYADLVNFYTSQEGSLIRGKVLAGYALHNLSGKRRKTARVSDISETQWKQTLETLRGEQSAEEREQESLIETFLKVRSDMFKVVMGWENPALAYAAKTSPRSTAPLQRDLTFSPDAIEARRIETKVEAARIRALDSHDAIWISEALDDPDVIGGVHVVPVMRQGIMQAVEDLKEPSENRERSAYMLLPGESLGYESPSKRRIPFYLDPRDEVVLREIFATGGPHQNGEVTSVDIAATMYAEQSPPGNTNDLQRIFRSRQAVQKKEREIGYELERDLPHIEALLKKKDPKDELTDQAVSAYLEQNGIWDPTGQQKEKYGAGPRHWINIFQRSWNFELEAHSNAYLPEDPFPTQTQISAARHRAEEDIKKTVCFITGGDIENYEKIDIETAGAALFLAIVMEPWAVRFRLKSYQQDHDGKGLEWAKRFAEVYSRHSGNSIVDLAPDDRRSKPPEFTREQIVDLKGMKVIRDRRITAATRESLKQKGIQTPTAEDIEHEEREVRQKIGKSYDMISNYIALKRQALESEGMRGPQAQLLSEKAILQMLNTVYDESLGDIRMMDIAFVVESMRNPLQVAQRLIRAAQSEPTEELAARLWEDGEKIVDGLDSNQLLNQF